MSMKAQPEKPPAAQFWATGAGTCVLSIQKRTKRTRWTVPPDGDTRFSLKSFAAVKVPVARDVKCSPSVDVSMRNAPVDALGASPHTAVGSTPKRVTSVGCGSWIVIDFG